MGGTAEKTETFFVFIREGFFFLFLFVECDI